MPKAEKITKHFRPTKDYAALRIINTRRAAKANAETSNNMEEDSNEAGPSSDTSDDRVKRSTDHSSGNNSNATPPMRGEAILPKGLPIFAARFSRTYKKQYFIRIFNELHQRQSYNRFNTKYNIFIPAFHELPVSCLGFYMRNDEVERLRYHTSVHAKHCNVKIYNNTAVATFETNASNTSVGNNNLGLKFLVLNEDVSKYRSGGFVHDQQTIIQSIFWGKNPAKLKDQDVPTSDFSGIGAEYILRNYDNKFRYTTIAAVDHRHMNAEDGDADKTWAVGEPFFPIYRHVKKRINASIDEGLLEEWNYTPKDGLLLGNFNYLIDLSGRCEANYTTGLIKSQNNIHWRSYGGINTDDKKIDEMPMTRIPMEGHNMENYNDNIFPANMNVHQDVFRNIGENDIIPIDRYSGNGIGTSRMPVCAFGLDPFISINEKTAIPTAAKAHIDLIIETSIDLDISLGADNQDQPAYTLSEWDQLNVPTILYGLGDHTRVEESWNYTTKHPHEKHWVPLTTRSPNAFNDIIFETVYDKPQPAKIPKLIKKGGSATTSRVTRSSTLAATTTEESTTATTKPTTKKVTSRYHVANKNVITANKALISENDFRRRRRSLSRRSNSSTDIEATTLIEEKL